MLKQMVAVALGAAMAAGCATQGHAKEEKHEHIAVSALPAAVRSGVEREWPAATIKEVERETYADGTVHYEVEVMDKDGKEHEAEFTADGQRLEEH